MIQGFSGFGFPKAHGAAFGLLAYQSTWLRVHYFQEFLCALLNEQPMGFYPPDQLAHEAQRRGIELRAPEVNASEAECTVEDRTAIRIGLGYVKGVKADEVAALVAARADGGPFATAADLAARAAAGRPALAQLAWAGACDALSGGDRRRALWQLGVAVPGERVTGGDAALPAARPARGAGAARAQPLGRDARRLRHHQRHPQRPPARPAAPRPPGGLPLQPRPPRPSTTARACGSRAWSSPASARAPPTASSSCCSRTSSGRST